MRGPQTPPPQSLVVPSLTPTPTPTPATTPTQPDNQPNTPHTNPTTTPPPPAGPTIEIFQVTDPECPNLPEVTVTWSVAGVDEVGLAVDNPDTPGGYGTYSASGTEVLPFACGGDPGTTVTHTYSIHAGTGGQQVSRTIEVSVEVPAEGGD